MSRAKHHDHNEEDEENGASPAHVRVRGLLLLIGAAAGILLTLVSSAYLAKHGYFPKRGGVPAMVLVFIPIAVALAGFIELLTGLALMRVPGKWDGLQGWQRGILMILIAFSPFIFYSIGVEFF
jgi:hypothetical protein